ncbi:MAG: MFS transporter [Clostridia bacterium]|nr:MFS transporter [Clostridia bacterium]
MPVKRELYIFTLYYAIVYISFSIYGSYISVYYLSRGLSIFQIGLLLAIGPISSVIIVPMWAAISDRVKYKVTILKTVVLGSACAVLLYPLVSGFYATAVVTILFMVFYSSIQALGDAITVDKITRQGFKFTTVRMGGTIGYALLVIVEGNYFRAHINQMFFAASAFLLLTFLFACLIPKENLHRPKAEKLHLRELFKNRTLVFILLFCLIMWVSVSFNSSFIGVYITKMHYNSFYIGLAMCTAALSEIPVLLFIQKKYLRFGAVNILIFGAFLMSLRLLLLFLATNIVMIIIAQAMQGVSYMTLHYSAIMFMNDEVPSHLKSTGQSLLAMAQAGLGSMLGSIGGGYVSGITSISTVYGLLSILAFSLACASLGIVVFTRKKARA